MQGQIVLIGSDDNVSNKPLIVEVEHNVEEEIDIVRFPQLKVTIGRLLLLDAIEFLKTH